MSRAATPDERAGRGGGSLEKIEASGSPIHLRRSCTAITTRTKGDNLINLISVGNRPIIAMNIGRESMAANPVVLYFEKQEDALLFTLAASSVMSAEGPVQGSDALVKIAEQICKASRITAKGVLNNT